MLTRFSVTLDDGKGNTRSLYTNEANLANVELQSNADGKVSVLVTPLPRFDLDKHFLVQVNEAADGSSVKRTAVVLRGITPDWLNAFVSTIPDPRQFGALLIADSSSRFAPGTVVIL